METSKNLPRDTFLYLLAIITLVVSASSFGALSFQLINKYFPDILSDLYTRGALNLEPIRQMLALLIVVFPVYLWVSWFLKKDVLKHPEKRELKIRRWLIYLTLFAAGLLIIGDVVALINSFLRGEITMRFILKILTVLFIGISVFAYYFFEVKLEYKKIKRLNIYSKIVIGIVVASIVCGFFLVGSPTQQRLVRFDERRISDLQTIQSDIVNYWQKKQKLPAQLSDLNDEILGIVVPVDPKTKDSYDYKVLSNLKFQLCADFETSSKEDSNSGVSTPVAPYPLTGSEESWLHDKGHACFDRTIDPQLLKPLTK